MQEAAAVIAGWLFVVVLEFLSPARERPFLCPGGRAGRRLARDFFGHGERPRKLGAATAMSNVRISNGSPTLERMEARQADYPKPSACRSLFGSVDHAELARELQKHSRDLEEASRRKWNFDFHRCQPLEGRYEWQAVSTDALPEFYSRPPRLPKAGAQTPGSDGNGNNPPAAGWSRRSQGISGSRRGGGGGEEEEEEEEEEDAAAALDAAPKTQAAGAQADCVGQQGSGGQRKRPASEDTFPPNKRANMTEEAISEGSPSASSVEQTPKKSSPRQCQT